MHGFNRSTNPEQGFLAPYTNQKSSSGGRGAPDQAGRGGGSASGGRGAPDQAGRGGGSAFGGRGALVQAGRGGGGDYYASQDRAAQVYSQRLPLVTRDHNPYMEMDPPQLEEAMRQYSETGCPDIRDFDRGFMALVKACMSFSDKQTTKKLLTNLVWTFVFASNRLPNASLERLLTNAQKPLADRIKVAELFMGVTDYEEFNQGPGESFRLMVKNWLRQANSERIYGRVPEPSPYHSGGNSWADSAMTLYSRKPRREVYEDYDEDAFVPAPMALPGSKKQLSQESSRFSVVDEDAPQDTRSETLAEKKRRLQLELKELEQQDEDATLQRETEEMERQIQQKKQARIAQPSGGSVRQGTGFAFGASTSLQQALALQEQEALKASISDADHLAAQQLAEEQATPSPPKAAGRGRAGRGRGGPTVPVPSSVKTRGRGRA